MSTVVNSEFGNTPWLIIESAGWLNIQSALTGQGDQEHAVVKSISGNNAPALKVGDVIVRVDPRYYRPTEVETLLGNPAKAKADLGWVPEITLDHMVAEMVAHDLQKARQHALLKNAGYNVNVSIE